MGYVQSVIFFTDMDPNAGRPGMPNAVQPGMPPTGPGSELWCSC